MIHSLKRAYHHTQKFLGHAYRKGRKYAKHFDMFMNAAGRTVRNYNMVFHSNLATCDVSDDAAAQLYEDARKVAAHNASQNGYTVGRVEDLACDFAVLPVL